jgi:ABC-type glycerol-3-phosphate transport system substrate-binding protein
MKKYSLLLSVLLILSILLAACGPTPEPEKIVETVEVEVEVTREVIVDPTACNIDPPESPVTINVYGWPFEIMNFYADEMKKCGEVDNIEVNVQLLDFTAVQEGVRLALSAGGESPYDIVHGSNPQMTEWGSEGWLLPLNDLIDKYRDEYDLDDISATAWAGGTVDGQIYGVPVVGNTLHLAYRSDLFEKYGLEPPTTYDEVIAACEVLRDEPSIDVPFTMDVSAGWAWEIEFLAFIRSYGADYVNDDNTPGFNSPEGVAAATKMKEVVDACMGPEHVAYGYEASVIGINTGAIAFTHIWASETPNMDDPEKSDFVGLIEFAPAAAPKPGGLLGGSAWNDYYCIPATTTVDPDLVFRVIMEAVDERSMQEAAQVGIVTRTSITEGVRDLPAASETIAKGVGIYAPNPAVVLAQSALESWLPFIGTGEMTPQEALDAAADEYIAEATAQGYLP